jgi:ribulose 1,5-bisphosphate synthetase/thiazole synthase
MCEFKIAVREKAHLDTVGVQALVVDQLARKHLRLRRVVRLDVDPALQALEAMAVGIAEILVEGDTISVHLALHPSGMAAHVTLSPSCRPAAGELRRTI